MGIYAHLVFIRNGMSFSSLEMEFKIHVIKYFLKNKKGETVVWKDD